MRSGVRTPYAPPQQKRRVYPVSFVVVNVHGFEPRRGEMTPFETYPGDRQAICAVGAAEGPMSWMPKNASVAKHDWMHPTSYAPSLVIDERQRSQNNGRCYAKAARENRAACSRLLCSTNEDPFGSSSPIMTNSPSAPNCMFQVDYGQSAAPNH